jgi:hypothetical protein
MAKKSVKTEKKKKTDVFPYEREDLVWEAVRRNEEYKEFYRTAKEDYPDGKDENKKFNKNSKNRWFIYMKNALSPDITAKKLRQKIIDGADPATVHPYHFMFNSVCMHSRIIPKDWQDWSAEEADDNMYLVDEDSANKLLKIIRQSKKYIPVWIAPWADEKEIKEEVTKILRPLKEIYKQEYDKMVRRKLIVSCNPKSIDKSIKLLERYDEIIDKFKTPEMVEQYGELEKKDGYYIIPELNSKQEKEEIISMPQEKVYMDSYKKSVLLIKKCP